MFEYFDGKLVDKFLADNTIVIDINGIGYLICISKKDFSKLPEINQNIKIFTILIHKEEVMMLYGFLDKDSKNIFKILTSVSGLGPKMAMQLLNLFEPSQIASFVIEQNHKELTKAKGIGNKLAQKIVIELKDKFKDFSFIDYSCFDNNSQYSQAVIDAKNVLISFGYEDNEIQEALNYAFSFVNNQGEAEDILKFALKFLSQ